MWSLEAKELDKSNRFLYKKTAINTRFTTAFLESGGYRIRTCDPLLVRTVVVKVTKGFITQIYIVYIRLRANIFKFEVCK